MLTREEILTEIRRTAEENGGKPLGRERFQRFAGISEYELGRHWARFGDALREAGFEPNELNAAYDESFLIDKFVELTRRLGRVPTRGEVRLERTFADPSFPNSGVYDRFGSKNELIGKILNHCRENAAYSDLVPLPESAYRPGQALLDQDSRPTKEANSYGFVYLVKGHAGEYKIGRTTLVDRRLPELGATSAVEPALVHEIKTDSCRRGGLLALAFC